MIFQKLRFQNPWHITKNRCKHIYKCFSQERIKRIEDILGATNQESCSRELSKLCEAITLDGIKANRQIYSIEKARECISGFDNHSCSSNSDAPAVCEEASVGRRGWKETCIYSDDCSGKNAKCLDKECTGDITPSSFQQECSEATIRQCKTLNCIQLKANLQNKTGICSLRCLSHSDCGEGSQCFKISDEANVCFSTCKSNSDCQNGFVCVDIGSSTGEKICFVDIP